MATANRSQQRRSSAVPDAASRRRYVGQDGLTLVEMMVAMLIMAVIFAAVAASLINFSRSSINTERRVEATSFANQLHEQLQALPWDAAYHVSADLGDINTVGGYSGSPHSFEGDPIVIDDGADLPYPSLPFEVVDVPDIYDDAYQVVTWASRPGVPEETIKRFTTVVQWSILGRTVEARLQSDRTATSQEIAGALPQGVEITLTPSPMLIEDVNADNPDDPDWRPVEAVTQLTIDAVFPSEWSLAASSVVASIPIADPILGPDPLVVGLTRIDDRVFRAIVDIAELGSLEEPGNLVITLSWYRDGNPDGTIDGTVLLIDADDIDDGGNGDDGGGNGDGTVPEVASATLEHTSVQIGRYSGGGNSPTNQMCTAVRVTAQIDNADSDVTVRATFNPDTGPQDRAMDPVGGTVNATGQTTYELVLAAGSVVWDRPPLGSPTSDTFRISVTGSDQSPVPTQSLSISAAPGPGNSGNGNC